MGKAGVQQLAGAMSVHGAYGDGVAQSELIELIYGGILRAGGVRLVDGKHDRLAGAQQHIGHVLVRRRHTGADIRDQHDHVRRVNGDLRLLPHEQQNLAVSAGLNAACVHHIKCSSAPLTFGIQPVAGDAGGILHDGETLSHQTVEEHRLAHVRPADDRHQRFCHLYPPPYPF